MNKQFWNEQISQSKLKWTKIIKNKSRFSQLLGKGRTICISISTKLWQRNSKIWNRSSMKREWSKSPSNVTIVMSNFSYSFWSKTDLERHKQSVHSLSTESAEFDDYICETCGTSYLHPDVLHEHIILWNYWYQIAMQTKFFIRNSALYDCKKMLKGTFLSKYQYITDKLKYKYHNLRLGTDQLTLNKTCF